MSISNLHLAVGVLQLSSCQPNLAIEVLQWMCAFAFADLPTDDNFLSAEYLLSENSMHFLAPTDTPPQEPHTARPPPNPSDPPPPLHNYLASASRHASQHTALARLTSQHAVVPPHLCTEHRVIPAGHSAPLLSRACPTRISPMDILFPWCTKCACVCQYISSLETVHLPVPL